jgi:hypothetical protein
LQLPVDVLHFMVLVQVFQVRNNNGVQKLPQVFIFAPEEFEEDWNNKGWANDILAPHDLERSDESHSNSWVHYRIVLLQHVDNLIAQVICQFVLVHS